MTWRAFLIGVLGVVGLSLLDPYTSFITGYGWLIIGSFPTGAVLIIVLLTLGLNVFLKLLRRAWALSQAELLLIWCMVIVGAVVPTEGLGRWWYHMLAGGPYMARRADIDWEDESLAAAPEELVLSKNPRSEAARRYFEGGGEQGRVPWGRWLRPLLHWAAFLLPLYLAVFFLCAMLRRQWVEVERLMFPLARVPLDFTEGSGEGGLLTVIFQKKGFLAGLVFAAAFRFVRALPLLFGAEGALPLSFPVGDILQGTPLEVTGFGNVNLHLTHVGFAYLVPADVSLSVWLFFLFSRAELLVGNRLALPEAGGGTWSPMMRWQQFGAYITFMGGMLFMARRHLAAVFRRAFGAAASAGEEREPVPYRFAFWGFVASVLVCCGWYAYHGMNVLVGIVVLLLLLTSFMVYARIVSQAGVPVVRNQWSLTTVIGGIGGLGVFGSSGAVIASMQSTLLLTGSTTHLAPMAMNSFRIAEVFKRRRRLLVPALMVAILVAMACTTHTVLTQAYSQGAVNFQDTWAVSSVPKGVFNEAQRVLQGQTTEWHRLHLRPFLFGTFGMAFLMFMRARFYWWPVHAIGLLTASSWNMVHRLWLAFLLGWLIKIGVMKLGGGRALRRGRYFFIGVIVVEGFVTGISAIVRTATGGAVPGF